jgi:hypothetical protein
MLTPDYRRLPTTLVIGRASFSAEEPLEDLPFWLASRSCCVNTTPSSKNSMSSCCSGIRLC